MNRSYANTYTQIDLDGKFTDILELCFYNAVLTGMSATGTNFTYVNQMASSNTDLSKRASWFTCACCPPNVTRLLGYVGGYLWSFQSNEPQTAVYVDIHLYSAAVLSIPIGDKVVEIEQKTNWPWEGTVEFDVRNAADIDTTIRLRIPSWAADWQISPSPSETNTEKGYLTLSSVWVKQNPKFTLSVPFKPRFISPHPYTNQNIAALARGPLIYCVEDFDNPWVDDHFQSLVIDPTCDVTESLVSDSNMGEDYVGLIAHNAASIIDLDASTMPGVQFEAATPSVKKLHEKLHFIPYCLRDNRGGKGHMRVGIRKTQ